MVAMRAFPTDTEVPHISTPESDVDVDTTILVVVFGCRHCETTFSFKVSILISK